MKKMQVKKGIHKVSNKNIIPIWEGRRDYAKRLFKKYIGTSTHFTLIFLDEDNLCNMFTTLEKPELIFELERCKNIILS